MGQHSSNEKIWTWVRGMNKLPTTNFPYCKILCKIATFFTLPVLSSRLLSHASLTSALFVTLILPFPGPLPLTSLIPILFLLFSQHLCLWYTLITVFWPSVYSGIFFPHCNGVCFNNDPVSPRKSEKHVIVKGRETLNYHIVAMGSSWSSYLGNPNFHG